MASTILTLDTMDVLFFHIHMVSKHHSGALKLNAILTLCTRRYHRFPQGKAQSYETPAHPTSDAKRKSRLSDWL